VTFKGFISADARLPKKLQELKGNLGDVLDGLKEKAGDKLKISIQDPQAGNGELAKRIQDEYGFQPMVAGLTDDTRFYFYMVLDQGGRSIPVQLPEQLDKAHLKRAIQSGLKRFAGGLLKTVALYTPQPRRSPYQQSRSERYNQLASQLRENAVVRRTDLKSGHVPEGSDLLLVVAPWELSDRQLFTIDQFLMRGGTVVVAASSYDVSLGRTGINAKKKDTGLEDWLRQKGLSLGKTMVLDPQNTPFPIPVERDVGGYKVREVHNLDYPYFADIRSEGMTDSSAITADLGQVTMSWPSPIEVDKKTLGDRKLTRLLESSPDSWTSDSSKVTPDVTAQGISPFEPEGKRGSQLLGAVVQGQFQSYFKDRPNPMLKSEGKDGAKDGKNGGAGKGDKKDDGPDVAGVIDRSPDSARVVLYSSASFLGDTALQLVSSGTQNRYTKPVELVQNTVDWALEDPGLLALRGKSHFSRLLRPLSEQAQMFWEYLNYALALAGLLILFGIQRWARKRRETQYLAVLNEGRA
jgi:ABC-2 type transport system permease protein